MGWSVASSFEACIEDCAKTSGCLDVSLSGVACYMKSTLEPAVKAPLILGAKLLSTVGVAKTTSSGKSSSTSSKSSTSTTTKA